MKTAGNTILITSGTSGIELGLALRFHDMGNKVIIPSGQIDAAMNLAPGSEKVFRSWAPERG